MGWLLRRPRAPGPSPRRGRGRRRPRRAWVSPTWPIACPTELSARANASWSASPEPSRRGRTVVCMDEPAAGFDTTESHVLGRRLATWSTAGSTILLVDHDMGLVLNVCDCVYVLEFGQVDRGRHALEMPRRPGSDRGLSGWSMTTALDIRSLGAGYRGVRGRARRRPARGRRRGRRAARTQRRGQDHHIVDDLGLVPFIGGEIEVLGRVGGSPSPPSGPRGLAHVPEDRSLVLRAHRAREPAPAGRADGVDDWLKCCTTSPRSSR